MYESDERVVSVWYTNHRGEEALRRILPGRLWFGSTSWYPEPQWILDAYDFDRNAERSFALSRIAGFVPDTERHVSHGRTPAGAA